MGTRLMDEADHAQRYEQQERESAPHRIRIKSVPYPLVVEGKRLCLDCHGEIPAERLRIASDVVRCAPCQRLREAGYGKGRAG